VIKGAAIPAAGFEADRIAEDIAFAAESGLKQLRFGIDWAAMQPRAGLVDGDWVECYRSTAEQCTAAGIEPWFMLLPQQFPKWFDNEGGFLDERAAGRFWPRWVESVTDALGDVAAGWVPIEAPFALAERIVPKDPRRHGEVVNTLIVAWRDAWRILRGGQPVATSIDVRVVRPIDETIQQAELARREDQLRWRVWLQGLRDGTISIPGRADRELADFAGSCDIVGIRARNETETILYRAAEMKPDRPLALTFKPEGANDIERTRSIEAMRSELARSAEELPIVSVTITPFRDAGGATDGIVTRERELKDSGHAFLY
jgi:Glycosyl hydrolase family 1